MPKPPKKHSTPKAPKKDSNKKLVTPKGRALRPKRPASTSLSKVDPLVAAYIREIQRYPLLSREEEHELAIKYYETKDRDSFQKLVTSNLRFVVKIAHEYLNYRTKLLDLVQEGNMGLVKAVQDFDPYKDVRLTTYAVWWIRSYIQEAILRNYSLVKIGTTQSQKKLFYRLRKEQKKLEQMGLKPSENIKLLASNLNVKEKEVVEMDQRLHQGDVSLNAPLNQEDRKEHIENLRDSHEAADEELGDAEQAQIFKKVLKQFAETLEGRERLIFNERLVSENPMTLQEIGDKYEVTKERARQLEEQIKAKLKKYMQENYPDFNILTQD